MSSEKMAFSNRLVVAHIYILFNLFGAIKSKHFTVKLFHSKWSSEQLYEQIEMSMFRIEIQSLNLLIKFHANKCKNFLWTKFFLLTTHSKFANSFIMAPHCVLHIDSSNNVFKVRVTITRCHSFGICEFDLSANSFDSDDFNGWFNR